MLACMLAELLAYSAPVNTSAELLPHSKAMPFEGNAIQPRRKERSSAQCAAAGLSPAFSRRARPEKSCAIVMPMLCWERNNRSA